MVKSLICTRKEFGERSSGRPHQPFSLKQALTPCKRHPPHAGTEGASFSLETKGPREGPQKQPCQVPPVDTPTFSKLSQSYDCPLCVTPL